jgi:glyoxylase-like metal-dependent hydrolase (beta-lactamase superfamily II)
MAWSSLLYPKKPTDLTPFVKPLPSNGSVPGLPEWRWLHTPGHAPGQVAFFRQRDRTLLAGDAFVTTRQESMLAVMSQTPEINGPPAYFTPDWNAARASVQHLASLNPEAVGTGHGPAMRGERMRQELHELANRFDAVARPVRGRYVHRSAQTGVNGVIDVPPVTALQTALTGAALLLALGAITTAFMRRRD